MEFWRVETVNGEGPYSTRAAIWCDSPYHPAPEKDGLEAVEHHEIFGFKNLIHLKSWFSEEYLEVLEECDDETFVITLYEAPETAVRHGYRQAVADKAQLKYRWSIPVSEAFNLLIRRGWSEPTEIV